jgi:hypothetical protein
MLNQTNPLPPLICLVQRGLGSAKATLNQTNPLPPLICLVQHGLGSAKATLDQTNPLQNTKTYETDSRTLLRHIDTNE